MSYNTDVSTKLFVQHCVNCGITFGMPSDFDDRLRETHREFYCPNGHNLRYNQETDAERYKRQLDEANRLLIVKNNMLADRDKEVETLARSKRSLQAHAKRVKTRTAAGVCPAGCRRHFSNLQQHIASKHPSWHAEPE